MNKESSVFSYSGGLLAAMTRPWKNECRHRGGLTIGKNPRVKGSSFYYLNNQLHGDWSSMKSISLIARFWDE
jgi:hypothetical protein